VVLKSADSNTARQGPRSSVPEVRKAILGHIQKHKLQPGDKLPTEFALSAEYAASRSTIRAALKSLEQEGVINVVQGHGRYLSGIGALTVERPVTRYESTTEMLESRGFVVTSAVLNVEEGPSTQIEADGLGIPHGTPVIRLLRIRYGNGRLLVVSLATVVREALPGPLQHRDWSKSITLALEAHGHHTTSSLARITAGELPADIVTRYKLENLGPWLKVEETCISRAGARTIFATEYYRGEEVAFNVLRLRG